jgi:hypothetical protein
MSAPLVVNLRDGSCWVRHAVTRGGLALYALNGVNRYPEPVVATLPELAEHGIAGSADALPMPVGSQPPSADAESARLRARVAELEEQRDRRRARLVALQNDALSMRGSLAPNGEGCKVPFELGETLTPAVDWLIARVAELETTPTVAYRAEHPDAGITLGHYGTAAAARKHCETLARREIPGASLDWIDDGEDSMAELVAALGEDELPTGYVVTSLDLDSEYDDEADE